MHTKTGKVCTQKAKLGNQNAAGHGAPEGNRNAEKYGFFSKYLPDETREISAAIEQADPLLTSVAGIPEVPEETVK